MGKRDELMRGRMDGMQLALKIAENDGIDALRKEIEFRGRTKINPNLAIKEMESALVAIKEKTVETVLIMSLMVLHDQFGFGPKRMGDFMDRYLKKSDCLIGGLANWMDYTDWLQDYLKADLNLVRMQEDGWARPWKEENDDQDNNMHCDTDDYLDSGYSLSELEAGI